MATSNRFSLAHYLLATEGLALIRSWAFDDSARSGQFLEETRQICGGMDSPPFSESMVFNERSAVVGYTAWAEEYDAVNAKNPLIPLESDVLDELLSPVKTGRALDAACGTGRQAERLLSLGYRVTGVDKTTAMLEVARHAYPEVNYLEGDLRDLPVSDAEFDLVLSTLALTHVPELEKIIDQFARVLRPGGRAVIVDVHPLQVLFGAHVMVANGAEVIAVRNQIHLTSRYFSAFKDAGLQVDRCIEPTFTEELVADLPAAHHFPEANRTAFAGTPALLVWSLRKEE